MPRKLSSGEIHFLRLIFKGQQSPTGWAKVSKILYPLVESLPPELVEHHKTVDGGGEARLEPEGANILRAMEWLP